MPSHPDFIVPEQYRNEIMSFVERGLNDLSISRTTFDWGIPVPGNPKHVMYVWVDALTNYITSTGFPDAKAAKASVLARRGPCDRQGYHALPCHLLAGVPDVGEAAGSQADCGARLPVQQGRENVEVDRQRGVAMPISSNAMASIRCATSSCAKCPMVQDGSYSHEAIVGAHECRPCQ